MVSICSEGQPNCSGSPTQEVHDSLTKAPTWQDQRSSHAARPVHRNQGEERSHGPGAHRKDGGGAVLCGAELLSARQLPDVYAVKCLARHGLHEWCREAVARGQSKDYISITAAAECTVGKGLPSERTEPADDGLQVIELLSCLAQLAFRR